MVKYLLFPCPSSWSSGGGACCADSQVCAPGGAVQPLPGAWLSGSCSSCEAPAQSQVQGDTRRNNNSGSSQLSSTAGSRTCSSLVLPAALLGAGPAVLILRCVHLGEMPSPLTGAGPSGSCLPCEASVLWQACLSQAQGETRRNNTGSGQIFSSGVSSIVTNAVSQSTLA